MAQFFANLWLMSLAAAGLATLGWGLVHAPAFVWGFVLIVVIAVVTVWSVVTVFD